MTVSYVYDVIVLGLGANGSSALYHLSKTNKKVLGIDKFNPPHTFGSSHGQSRIIRQAYHENPFYVPFVKAAYQEWAEIEAASSKSLLLKTGGLMLGSPDSEVISGALLSAKTHGIPYEYLNSKDLKKRYPAFKVNNDTVGILEKDAGILFPEECITAYLEQAFSNGAKVRVNEAVTGIKQLNDAIEITTSLGVYFTEKLIIAAGAWTGSFTGELKLPLTVERQVLYWFKDIATPQSVNLQPADLPVYIWEYLPQQLFYGFPDLGDGLKIAHHHAGKQIVPDELSQEVSREEIDHMQRIVSDYMDVQPAFNYAAVCMYTNTPDENFIIDFHPGNKNIIIASPCSGHGFKFSSFTGKILSDMAIGNKINLDLSPFRINRF